MAEYLEDYASERTKAAGYSLIEKELEKLPDSMQKEKIIAHLEAVKNGTRDLRF
jgi:2-iminoacetate synthase